MSKKDKEILKAQAEEVKTEPAIEAEAPKVEAEPVKEEVEAPEPKVKKENLMYVGDSIIGVVRHSTVYADGVFTPAIDKCIAAFPAMARLFVKIDDIPGALKEVKEKHSPLYVINKEVTSKFTRRN